MDFNDVANPADIPHHDGVTHLMIAPEPDEDPALITRWQGLRRAIGMAGGHSQTIAGAFNYLYPRDLCVLVGPRAFHPTTPSATGRSVDYRTRAFLPFTDHYGYARQPLDVLPDYGMDGGNFIPAGDILISGEFTVSGEVMDIDGDQFTAKRAMALESGMTHVGLQTTTWHIDTVAGLLPDGRILVKLDETDYRHEAEQAGIADPFISMAGVQPWTLPRLARVVGRKNILTFSLFPHDDADVVCGPEGIAGSTIASRAFGLAANSIVVGDTLVSETLPPKLSARLKSDGIKTIGPRDAGVDTFVYGDEGFVGGARCLTLAVSHQRRAAPQFFF